MSPHCPSPRPSAVAPKPPPLSEAPPQAAGTNCEPAVETQALPRAQGWGDGEVAGMVGMGGGGQPTILPLAGSASHVSSFLSPFTRGLGVWRFPA